MLTVNGRKRLLGENEGHQVWDPIMNSTLTDLDKAYAIINYPRSGPLPDEWTFKDALLVAGVDTRTIDDLVQLCKEEKYEDIRSKFNNWNLSIQHEKLEVSRREREAEAEGREPTDVQLRPPTRTFANRHTPL